MIRRLLKNKFIIMFVLLLDILVITIGLYVLKKRLFFIILKF